MYNNIIALIENSKISQRKFSKDLNYSRVNLLRWKKGTYPNVQSLIEISKYLVCGENKISYVILDEDTNYSKKVKVFTEVKEAECE